MASVPAVPEEPYVRAAESEATEGTQAAADGTATTGVFTRTATFLSAAKERVGEAAAQAAALAKNISVRAASRDGSGAPLPPANAPPEGPYLAVPAGERPPSVLDQVVDEQHAKAVLLAHRIMDASSEVSRKVEASVISARESTVAASWRAYQSAVQGLRHLTAPSRRVAAVVKADLRTKPVPQVLLLCCNWVATRGLTSTHLFQEPHPPAAAVQALMHRLEDRLVLLPADLDPSLAAAVILHFLATLDEPLLTFKLADRWVAAGQALTSEEASADAVPDLLSDLPLANWSTLKLLVETLYRVASQSNVTGMNAAALSTVIAPVLLWREHPAATASAAANAASKASTTTTGGGAASSASQYASATLQAIRNKWTSGGTSASGATSPSAATTAARLTGPTSNDGSQGEAGVPTLPVSEAQAKGSKAPGMVLDDDEEDVTRLDAAHLERAVIQQQQQGGKGAAAAGAAEAVATAGGVPLQEEELRAVGGVLQHLINFFDDHFVLSGP